MRKVLFEYHPLESKMVLQLSQATFQQWEFGTVMDGRRSVRAPHPGNAEQPDFVQKYMGCPWRENSISLLDYFRKTGPNGAVAG